MDLRNLQKEIETYWKNPLGRELCLFAARARGKRLRTRVEFAEQSIIIPEGPHKNFAWRAEYQPFCAAGLKLMDECSQRKFRFSGCVQSGKSFIGVIAVLWHLLERGEDVGYAVPDLDQSARDKWQKEFLPVLMASPDLRQYLPESGEGSKGGTPTNVMFMNGAVLRFISGGGADHHRSNFTVHCVFKTEVDRYDKSTEGSRETSPPEQIENRTEAHGDLAYSYEECTVTAEDGRIWSEIQESTNHKFHVICPHCSGVVCPQREDFRGIEECQDIIDAEEAGHFVCPGCASKWTEDERQTMLNRLIPVGENQTATLVGDKVDIVGDTRRTKRCGFTWNAFHNRFWSTSKIGGDEWSALYSRKPTEMDLKRRQHAWTLPSEPDVYTVTPLSVRDVMERGSPRNKKEHWTKSIPLRYCPPNTIGITAGVDVGKRQLHFVVRAFYQTEHGVNSRVIDLGQMPVRSDEFGLKKALPEAVLALDDRFNSGYAEWNNSNAHRKTPQLRAIDGGWQGKEVGRRQEDLVWLSLLMLEQDGRNGWLMVLGRGQSEPPGKGSYSHPKSVGNVKDRNAVIWIGEQCHIRKSAKHYAAFSEAGAINPASYCILNSDEFKEILRTGLGDTPVDADGAVLSFNAATKEENELLRTYAQQVTAESRTSKHVVGRGRVTVFDNDSKRANHLGDADCYALAMASVLEYPVTTLPVQNDVLIVPEPEKEPLRTPGGQRYLATQRGG